MGKGSDKMYITSSEYSGLVQEGGMKFGGTTGKLKGTEFKRLPFYACALSLQPFENPMMDPRDGSVYDLVSIVPWLKKHGVSPVTGEKLSSKDLVKLNFSKNAEGDYYCPITFKTFNEHTHIVAIRTSGNVFAYQAVQELNIQAKNWKDLLTDEPFTRQDIITLQDPHNLEARDLNRFYYVKNELKAETSLAAGSINAVGTTSRALKELEAKQQKEREKAALAATKDPAASVTPSFVTKDTLPTNAAHFSNNRMAGAFTSTSFANPATKNERVLIDEEELMFSQIKTKGYAAIRTNLGQINLELHADMVPKTVFNFIMLAKSGYYTGVSFHRNIKNFMVQGGDPTGTGKGGKSFWGKDFEDEIKGSLKHDSRGVLSMANRGKNTNSSQFFITYKPTPHLDLKHSVFGKVVGGMEVLTRMEEVKTEEKTDKPVRPIIMEEVDVVVDPFEEWKEAQKRKEDEKAKEAARDERANREYQAARAAREKRELDQQRVGVGESLLEPSASSTSSFTESAPVGKYLKAAPSGKAEAEAGDKRTGVSLWDLDDDAPSETAGLPPPKKVKMSGAYGNFSNF
ncbi:peptidyl-prolyl cis-trans isomerase-like 2 [Hyaloraphidium curvatum]|nr:peptidyl-prolyl cis-trans isomerase-like 2 [Hyaloraphidium curvatum]